MARIDLDDLPPRIAQTLAGLAEGEALLLVQNGAVVARLTASTPPTPAPEAADPPPEEAMAEVMEQFKAMIEDEF
jgi:antitoxin (DNA-binding transcriptional repressor) of toxin-antitoxin stability system